MLQHLPLLFYLGIFVLILATNWILFLTLFLFLCVYFHVLCVFFMLCCQIEVKRAINKKGHSYLMLVVDIRASFLLFNVLQHQSLLQ